MKLELVKRLGNGGFGNVDLVKDENGAMYAGKAFSINQPLPAELVPNVRKRFVREAQLQLGMKHRNIVPIMYAELEGDAPWYLSSTTHGMATTLTAVKLDGSRLVGAHCGDTRCVLQRGTGIRKLTVEHTEAQRLFEAGKLSKEQLLTYPRRNVLDSALGVQEGLRIDIIEHDLQPGDRVLITSDGVHEILRVRAILDLMHGADSVEGALGAIRESVVNIGAEDNFSAACAFVL